MAEEIILREDLVSTAVKFLTNPSIQKSPQTQKHSFLRSKGLTDEEIKCAFERGAALLTLPAVASTSSELFLYKNSRISLIREFLFSLALFGGITYGLYWVYKKWVEYLLFGERPKKKTVDERLTELSKSFESLVNDLRQEIITVRSEVDRLNHLHTSGAVSRVQIESLISDIASVKGILLNRNQFPSLSIRAEPPSIPAWQLQSSSLLQNTGSADGSPTDKDCKDPEDDIIRMRGERSESGGSNSSEGEAATKNSDSSLEIIN